LNAHVVAIFQHVLERERFYRVMLCGTGYERFTALFTRSLSERIEHRSALQEQHASLPIWL
jgi:hypothetical protein